MADNKLLNEEGDFTLSGGEFGGRRVDWPKGETQITLTDDNGGQWMYDITVSAGPLRAEFVKFEEAA